MPAVPSWDGLGPYAQVPVQFSYHQRSPDGTITHTDFRGKTSIKSVLTPLVPELTYDGMEVADGMTASVRLARLILEPEAFSDEARKAERRALLAYCELDTLAMVRLLERLEELAEKV